MFSSIDNFIKKRTFFLHFNSKIEFAIRLKEKLFYEKISVAVRERERERVYKARRG